jgi:hypothetical protein
VTAARRFLLSLAVLLVAGVGAASAAACGGGPYLYAGLAGASRVAGVGASITPAPSAFAVRVGHVAGWVGVGGPGQGPNGTDEWIQVGFSAFPSWEGNDLYFEVARPGRPPRYSRLRANVASGQQARVAVLEMRNRRDWWRVWLDGSPASAPIHLPQSTGRWRPVVTAESWDAGQSVCNDFGYRFDRLRVAHRPGGRWSPLGPTTPIDSTATLLVRHFGGSFVAAGGPLARQMFAVTTG